MSNPKEKAWNLYHTYRTLEGKFGDKVLYNYDAKQCALIVVDEIQEFMIDSDDFNIYWVNFWREVKNEIKLL